MIVCIAPTSNHFDDTHNTLLYAEHATKIKTTRNVVNVDRHVGPLPGRPDAGIDRRRSFMHWEINGHEHNNYAQMYVQKRMITTKIKHPPYPGRPQLPTLNSHCRIIFLYPSTLIIELQISTFNTRGQFLFTICSSALLASLSMCSSFSLDLSSIRTARP
ncbi:hypothetical protein PILCRDRAFT_469680 [Piloderma croceum F 1598]|uniref:Kinesin motor domain-containing protein n=1 Tax=Piloderma croceum (strain F 1598) TaxID=765440 RepID=A0A0C3B7C8_PILCF|nr:hypothetical protein PILCRDRAFT_469680 [Piloderma croceum F 1598]